MIVSMMKIAGNDPVRSFDFKRYFGNLKIIYDLISGSERENVEGKQVVVGERGAKHFKKSAEKVV